MRTACLPQNCMRCFASAASSSMSSTGLRDRLRHFFASKPRIILGSESMSRREIMDELARVHGFSYEATKASIDESALGSRNSRPEDLVLLLAQAKAEAIIKRLPEQHSGFLLTCDQVVVHNGNILEKPRSIEEARKFIEGYGWSPGKTVGSVICSNLATGKTASRVDVAEVHFNPIPKDVIDQLLEEGTVLKCAGGLMIEHPLVTPLITRIQGTEDSVKGLSKQLVLELLLEVSE